MLQQNVVSTIARSVWYLEIPRGRFHYRLAKIRVWISYYIHHYMRDIIQRDGENIEQGDLLSAKRDLCIHSS